MWSTTTEPANEKKPIRTNHSIQRTIFFSFLFAERITTTRNFKCVRRDVGVSVHLALSRPLEQIQNVNTKTERDQTDRTSSCWLTHTLMRGALHHYWRTVCSVPSTHTHTQPRPAINRSSKRAKQKTYIQQYWIISFSVVHQMVFRLLQSRLVFRQTQKRNEEKKIVRRFELFILVWLLQRREKYLLTSFVLCSIILFSRPKHHRSNWFCVQIIYLHIFFLSYFLEQSGFEQKKKTRCLELHCPFVSTRTSYSSFAFGRTTRKKKKQPKLLRT